MNELQRTIHKIPALNIRFCKRRIAQTTMKYEIEYKAKHKPFCKEHKHKHKEI